MDVEGTAGGLDIVVVPMTSEHLDDVIALWERMDGLLLSDADRPENLDRYLSRNPGLSHVAIREDRIIGAVLCGHDGRRGYLYPSLGRAGSGTQRCSANSVHLDGTMI